MLPVELLRCRRNDLGAGDLSSLCLGALEIFIRHLEARTALMCQHLRLARQEKPRTSMPELETTAHFS